MVISEIFTIISSVAALGATVIAAIELHRSRKSQEKTEENNRKVSAIEAFNRLQEQVLDKFVSYPKKEIWNLLNNLDEPEIKVAYDDCRAMIAKLEHFAVGVNNDVYDYDTVDKLGGIHLIYLFDKVEPIINNARKNQSDNEKPYYCEFEKMVVSLRNNHPECK